MADDFYELAKELESLQSDLEESWKADPDNRKRRREILSAMKTNLATMHEQHRRWLDSLADTDEPRLQRQQEVPPQSHAA